MCHYVDRQEITSSGSSVSDELNWTQGGKISSTEVVAREPTEARKVGTRRVITDFTGRTQTVTPPGTALEMVLEGASPAERVGRTDITA